MDAAAPLRLWYCDLTYTQQTVASDIMPAGVGCIAAFTERYLARPIETRIFKHPDRLARALADGPAPHLIGFSNYVWNKELSARIAEVIKRRLPDVVTVFGGPNYPTTAREQESFLRRHPMIDFYVVWEGEIAFAKLVEALAAVDFAIDRVPDDLPSVHKIAPDGSFVAAALVERIWDLTQIPSPYLNGMMDEFFDGVLLPIVQTKRGCPFKCTFCTEGNAYYSRVAKTAFEKTDAEIRYISKKMAALIAGGAARTDFHISDSNFAMFKDDLAVCETIAEMQRLYGYPEYINVATGKNHKERVLSAAALINGALRLSGAVRSLDRDVLANIKRDNIDEQGLMALALEASAIGANSYSEIILGLPGDSVRAHFDTIRKVVEADFNNVCLYQLMLLPGTDLATDESKERWRMVTRYRVLPRCFGHYEVLDETVTAAEIEEVCVANSSITFDDYLECRRFHLIVNLFFNDGVFKEALRLLGCLGLSKFEWLERIYRMRSDARFEAFVEQFLAETRDELWESRDALDQRTRRVDVIERYIAGEAGANLIFKYKSLSIIEQADTLSRVAAAALSAMLTEHGQDHAVGLGCDLIEFAATRMRGIFSGLDQELHRSFSYAVDRFAADVEPDPVESYALPEPTMFRFVLSEEQKRTIRNFTTVYGDNVPGYTRIVAKVYVRRLFREAAPVRGAAAVATRRDEFAFGDRSLSGLNEFAI